MRRKRILKMDYMTMNKKKPEVLAPAGDMEKLRFSIAYGADAVYLGGEHFGLRVKSNNFTLEEIREAVAYCHDCNKKVYITVNIFAHNEDIDVLPEYLRFLNDIGPDGLLISDPGVVLLAKEFAPSIPLHISTQANNVNWKTVEFWQRFGAERVVLGRELSLAEMEEIRRKTTAELEIFVHGAMCMSYSGRCLLSNYLTGRDANRGACTHPCRWKYALVEQQRPGEYLPLEEDERGSYIMNSKDLELLPYLPQLYDIGIDSFKIEGRVKSSYYVAVVTGVYREAVDCLVDEPECFEERLPQWLEELCTVSHRQYTGGFIERKPTAEDHRYETSSYERLYDFVAIVKGYDEKKQVLILEQRNHFAVGETLEFVPPKGTPFVVKVKELFDEEDHLIAKAPHAQMTVKLPWNRSLPALTIVRRKCHGME